MTRDESVAEKAYIGIISVAKSLRDNGLLSEEEYAKINAFLQEEYHPILSDYLSEKSLDFVSK